MTVEMEYLLDGDLVYGKLNIGSTDYRFLFGQIQ